MVKEKLDLENLAELTVARLGRAEKLTYLLKDEGVSWVEKSGVLQQEFVNLTGDVFLASGAVSYCGPFTGSYRQELISSWIEQVLAYNIPVSENFSVIKTLGDPVLMRDWMMNGLPSDLVSQDNAIYTTKGYRWPLMIDP